MENENITNDCETKRLQVRQKQKKKDPNCYRFGKVLGEGSFSCVYLAKDIDNGREYAIKVCEKEHIVREKKQEYVNREKEALNLLSNTKGIISLSCTFQDTKSLYFVLTFAPNGEILKLIRKQGCFSVATARFYASELLCAIENMARKNIIHRDLKPENLLLTDDMHLMIADFGSAKILPKDYNYVAAQEEIDRLRAEESNSSDDEVMTRRRKHMRRASFVGTAQYVSPEILKGNASHPASDLWAFGCVLYQMLVGSPPFRAGSEYLIFQKIQNRDYMYPNNFPDENAKDLITKLLQLNPESRLGAEDMHDQKYISIRNHAFFDGVNWEEVFKHPPPEQINDSDESSSSNDNYISDEIEPGLGQERQLRMIFENDFVLSDNRNQSAGSVEVRSTDNNNQIIQYENDVTCFLIQNETILRQGFVYKKKGLFPRRRLLILTNIPRLIYIDPTTNIQKGEIIFQNIIRCEARNFRQFYVHTPNRIYNLEDTLGGALDWCEDIDRAKQYLNISGSSKLTGI